MAGMAPARGALAFHLRRYVYFVSDLNTHKWTNDREGTRDSHGSITIRVGLNIHELIAISCRADADPRAILDRTANGVAIEREKNTTHYHATYSATRLNLALSTPRAENAAVNGCEPAGPAIGTELL